MMRLATCISEITLTLQGNRESVRISKGSQVDLDRVIGQRADGTKETVADQLGPHIQHFDVAPAKRTRRQEQE